VGRWAQRQRTGGGFSLNFITRAEITGSDTVIVTYISGLNIDALTPGMFESFGSTSIADTISPAGINQIMLSFPSPTDSDVLLSYGGVVPSILGPQSIAYS